MKFKPYKLLSIFVFSLLFFIIIPTTALATDHQVGTSSSNFYFDLDARGVQAGDTLLIANAESPVYLIGNPDTVYDIDIICQSGGYVNIKMYNLRVRPTTNFAAALKVRGSNNAIEINGTCSFYGNSLPGVQLESGATLTLTGSGTLTAVGGDNSAGIGGAYGLSGGTLNTSSCTIYATGGSRAAGIGGGYTGHGGTVNITGGKVVAYDGSSSAGIGGGGGFYGAPAHGVPSVAGGNGGTVNISGNSIVYASGSEDIGHGIVGASSGTLNISGNAKVFLKTNTSPTPNTTLNHEPGIVLSGSNLAGVINAYALTGIDSSWESSAGGYFLLPNHSVSVTAGINGSVSPSGNRTVPRGDDLVITPTPDEDYRVASITSSASHTVVDNNDGTYTIESILATDTVNVLFEITPIAVTDIAFDKTYIAIGENTSDTIANVLPYTITPADTTNSDVTFSSSNTNIVTIDNVTGIIRGYIVGRSEITITSDDTTNGIISDTCIVEVIDTTPIDPSVHKGNIIGTLVDHQDNPMSNYLITLYSTPTRSTTDTIGKYQFINIPYSNHTLVISNNDNSEIGRFALNFTYGNTPRITVDNVGKTVDIIYNNITSTVSFTIQANDELNDINIINSGIIEHIIPNPSTYDSSTKSYVYACVTLIIVLLLFILYLSRKRTKVK